MLGWFSEPWVHNPPKYFCWEALGCSRSWGPGTSRGSEEEQGRTQLGAVVGHGTGAPSLHPAEQAVPAASLPGLSGAGTWGLPRGGFSTWLCCLPPPLAFSALRAHCHLQTNTFCPEAEAATSSAGAGTPELSPASVLSLALLSLSLQEEQAQCGGDAGAESSCHSQGYN